MLVGKLALVWKADREASENATREKPTEWAFSPLARAARHGKDQIGSDAAGDASIKQLLRVRILASRPSSLFLPI